MNKTCWSLKVSEIILKMSRSRIMDPCVPLPLDKKRLTDLVEKAKDYCLMHG